MDLSEFQCIICRELKPNIRQTQCCPKFYCQECIQNMEDSSICTICKQHTSFKECPQISRLINIKLGNDFGDEFAFTNLMNTFRDKFRNYFSPKNKPNTTNDNLPHDDDPNTGFFKIKVMNMHDVKLDLYVEGNETIEILKLKIQQQDGIRPEYQRLIFLGKQLENHNTISFYKIKPDSTIHLVSRYNGS
ncbi:12820_t:CDS:2 [Cetraspora pellucida]|uniref:12820_t:CDS:1 n=1 Tax=Cetraspora pellucida TaxID=1433469 RepID=A0ACA9L7K8_9GLOM|nr:12820_t:CDS:2 [Cetraspora pellucida]